MKNITYFFSVLLLVTSSCMSQENKSDLTPTAFNEMIGKAKDAVVLDVRTPEEWKEGTLAGALMIDYKNESFKNELAKLDKEKTYLVYCRSGRRSGEAMGIMKEMGFKAVYNLKGGIQAWTESKLPVTPPGQ